MTWQPIETAPKDGTWFVIAILYGDEVHYEVGRYEPLIWKEYEPVDIGLFKQVEKTVYEWSGFNNFSSADHWMPLPEAPK